MKIKCLVVFAIVMAGSVVSTMGQDPTSLSTRMPPHLDYDYFVQPDANGIWNSWKQVADVNSLGAPTWSMTGANGRTPMLTVPNQANPNTYCRREELGAMSFLAFIDRTASHF